MRSLYFVVATVLFFGCKAHENSVLLSNQTDYIFDTGTRAYKADFTTSWATGHDVISDGNHTWMPYSFRKTGNLLFLDLDSDSLIELLLMNPGCNKLHTTISENGIYVINENSDLIYFRKGSITPSLLMNMNSEITGYAKSGMMPEWYKPGSDQRYNIPDSVLYFRVNQNYDSLNGTYSKFLIGYPITAKLDLKTKNISFFGKAPKFVTYGEYGLLSNVFDLYIDNRIIYSTAIDGKITTINTLNNQEITVERKSRYQTRTVSRYHSSKLKSMSRRRQEKWDHALYSAHYEPLFYNPHDKKYYRIFHPEMSKLNENGLLNTESDKQSVLMVFDQELNLEEEIVLPIHSTNFVKILPFKDGIGLFIQGALTQEGQYVKLPLFRIRKKK